MAYLIYVYHHHLKVEKILIHSIEDAYPAYTSAYVIKDVIKEKTKWHTKVPTKSFKLGYGKVWCENEEDIERCKNIIRHHYKEAGLTLVEEGEPSGYKRTKEDSLYRCKFCGKQFNHHPYRKWAVRLSNPRRYVAMCKECSKWTTIVWNQKEEKLEYQDTTMDDYWEAVEKQKGG